MHPYDFSATRILNVCDGIWKH